MLVDFSPRDRGIVDSGLKMHAKLLDTVIKQLERVNLATLQAAGEAGRVKHLHEALMSRYADAPDLMFSREFAQEDLLTLQISVSLYLEKAQKVEEAQQELTIDTGDTDERITQAQDLADRLKGQASLALGERSSEYDETSIEISGSGIEKPIRTTGRALRRAAESLRDTAQP